MTLCIISTIYSQQNPKKNKAHTIWVHRLHTRYTCIQTKQIHWLSHQLKSVHFLLLSIVVSLLSPFLFCSRSLRESFIGVHWVSVRFVCWLWVFICLIHSLICSLYRSCPLAHTLHIYVYVCNKCTQKTLWHLKDFLSFASLFLFRSLWIENIKFVGELFTIPFKLRRFCEKIVIFQHFSAIKPNKIL